MVSCRATCSLRPSRERMVVSCRATCSLSPSRERMVVSCRATCSLSPSRERMVVSCRATCSLSPSRERMVASCCATCSLSPSRERMVASCRATCSLSPSRQSASRSSSGSAPHSSAGSLAVLWPVTEGDQMTVAIVTSIHSILADMSVVSALDSKRVRVTKQNRSQVTGHVRDKLVTRTMAYAKLPRCIMFGHK